MAEIFTIGYGNLPIEDFISRLREYAIEILIDVRSRPYSRGRPWYRKRELAGELAKSDIEYRFMGDSLGGYPDNQDLHIGLGQVDYKLLKNLEFYREAIAGLITLATNQRICLMCAEAEPARCHRAKLIAESLWEGNIKVMHITREGSLLAHERLRRDFNDRQGELL